MDAILNVVRTGCAWRQLPADFPPWQTVYWCFHRWEQALDTDRRGALLQIAGLVDHQHRVDVAQGGGDVVAQVVTDAVGIPARPSQQVLHSVRVGLPGMLSDRPAVLARQVSQQPQHEPADPPTGLHPRKPGGHPVEQPLQPVLLGITARDSLPIVMLFHAAVDTCGQLLLPQFRGEAYLGVWWLIAGLYFLAAGALIWQAGTRRLATPGLVRPRC